MVTRKQFYKSKAWEDFRKIVIAERTADDGFVYCAHCGKPIVNKYDLIVHHKKELDEVNVNDVEVALNPDNVECIHFDCHNKVHKRFGYGTPPRFKGVISKKVYIVYGSSCSGKSTYVEEHAEEKDLVMDLDKIKASICITNDIHKVNPAINRVAFDIRETIYKDIQMRRGNWRNAWVIGVLADEQERERLKQRLGADEIIQIKEEKNICIERLQERFEENTKEYSAYMASIEDFFKKNK